MSANKTTLKIDEKLYLLNSYLQKFILLLAGFFVLLFFFVASYRASYPFDIEWMEGGMVEHVSRVVSGEGIYVEPSLDFVPYIYTPVYFYASAAFAKVFGAGYFPLRLVSIISTFFIFLFIFLIVKKETKSSKLGLISTGLFAACFSISGFWYDLARVDSMFIAFFIASIFFLRREHNPLLLILSGALAALSFLTKQTAAILILPLIVYLPFKIKFKSLYYIFPTLIITIGASFYFNQISKGWHFFWLYGIPSGHIWLYQKIFSFWILDLFVPLFFALGIAAFYFYAKRFVGGYSQAAFYLVCAVGMFGVSWLSRIHLGGYFNVLIPAFAAAAILFGLGLSELFKVLAESKSNGVNIVKFVVLLGIAAQFFVLLYNPIPQMPTSKDYEYADKFYSELKNIEGEVFIPDHQYVPKYSGKKSRAHYYVLRDLINSDADVSKKINTLYERSLSGGKFSAVILDKMRAYPEIEKHYRFERAIFPADDFLKCKTGGRKTRPNFIYVPKK